MKNSCISYKKVWMVANSRKCIKMKMMSKNITGACVCSMFIELNLSHMYGVSIISGMTYQYITQVLPVNGEYTAAKPVGGTVLVNIGDLMQQWTADKLRSTVSWVGDVRVPKTLTFKTRPSAQPFLWKWVLFVWEWKPFSYHRLSTQPCFETEAQGNSEMAY